MPISKRSVNLSVSVAIGHLVLTRKLASFFSPQKILPWSLGALACTLFAASETRTLLGFHISLSFVMLCCAVAYTNVFAYLSNHARPDQQGEIMGLGVSVQCLAEWIPPLAVGVFAITLPKLPLLFGSVSCIAAIFILVFEKRKNK